MRLPHPRALLRAAASTCPYVADPRRAGWSSCPAAGRRTSPTRRDPSPDSPAIVLLHARRLHRAADLVPRRSSRCRERFRVVTLDQRWHGRGINSEEFSLARLRRRRRRADRRARARRRRSSPATRWARSSPSGCWRQHPRQGRRAGALRDHRPLPIDAAASASSTPGMGATMLGAAHASRGRGRRCTPRARPPGRWTSSPATSHEWALAEFRSTSPWAVAQAVAALGRHHSRPWLREIDVPTAVVVNRQRPRASSPPASSRWPAVIPGATIHDIDGRPRGVRAARPRRSCRPSSRRSRPSTRAAATSARAGARLDGLTRAGAFRPSPSCAAFVIGVTS